MASANSTSSRSSKRNADFAQFTASAGEQAIAVSTTPAGHRLLRIFAAVPEHQHPAFFQLMESICYGCNWQVDPNPSLQSVPAESATVIDASSRFGSPSRVNAILLFGSQKLTRGSDDVTWFLSGATAAPTSCTERESMFINAALRAARGV